MQPQELKPVDPANPGRGGTRGSIVTLGSGNSFAAAPHLVQYTAAKHAVLGVTKNAGEFGPPTGIASTGILVLRTDVGFVQSFSSG